ncbi:MAG: caspase family protein [Alphaproteobacteria bacterium]|nr:caspase family protein [Alphaproteobacteria bacterium]
MRWSTLAAAGLLALLLGLSPGRAAQEDALAFGPFHALVIGNNDYQHLSKLKTAVADAEATARLLGERYGFKVKLLTNATREQILGELNRLRAELTAEDNLLIYYAGHGTIDRQTNTGFWVPVDSAEDDDLKWIATEDLSRRVKAMAAKHVLVVADSC